MFITRFSAKTGKYFQAKHSKFNEDFVIKNVKNGIQILYERDDMALTRFCCYRGHVMLW